ncbi:MAG: SDR family oxidoreductase [Mycobacteriales bacterium]
MGRLADRVALVTGAARGQGAAESRLFAREGARVVLADVLDSAGQAVAEEIGEAAVYVHLHVSREEDWSRALAVVAELGLLRVLVNNAGVMRPSTIANTSVADYLAVIEVNQLGTFLGIRSAIAPMRAAGGGSIVNVSSIDGIGSKNGLISYTASKFAIRGMTKTAALELGRFGIRVNSVHPGGVDTDMGNPARLEAEILDASFSHLPIPRAGRVDDVAAMVLFLAGDESSYCTGAEFVVDGGWLAGDLEPGLPGGLAVRNPVGYSDRR